MRAGGTFFRLEMKRYAKAVPIVFLESILFGIMILVFGIFASKYVYGEQAIGKIKVGIVSIEDEKLSGMLVDFVSSMDSMKESCSFEMMDEAAAYEGLKNGSIYAAVILPEGLIDGIMNGQNIPAKVVFGTSHSRMETDVFSELAKAGGRLLATAQAGIYAADELCILSEHGDWIGETEDYLNRAYLQYALNRDRVFDAVEVQATGNYSLLQYYCSALLLVFLSFIGLTLAGFSNGTRTAVCRIMEAKGFARGWQLFLDVFAYTMIFTLSGMVPAVLFLQGTAQKTGFTIMSFSGIAGTLMVLFAMGLLIRLLVMITGSHTAGLGVSFLVLLILMIGSGLFIPQAFLPPIAERVGNYLPYRFFHEMLLKSIC